MLRAVRKGLRLKGGELKTAVGGKHACTWASIVPDSRERVKRSSARKTRSARKRRNSDGLEVGFGARERGTRPTRRSRRREESLNRATGGTAGWGQIQRGETLLRRGKGMRACRGGRTGELKVTRLEERGSATPSGLNIALIACEFKGGKGNASM